MTTIADRLRRLRALAPNRDATGQLYKNRAALQRKFARVTMYTVMVSSENNYHVHQAIFSKNRMSAIEWSDWFSKHFEEVYLKGILPGFNIRSAQQWSVYKILGWIGNVEHKSRAAKMGRKRH